MEQKQAMKIFATIYFLILFLRPLSAQTHEDLIAIKTASYELKSSLENKMQKSIEAFKEHNKEMIAFYDLTEQEEFKKREEKYEEVLKELSLEFEKLLTLFDEAQLIHWGSYKYFTMIRLVSEQIMREEFERLVEEFILQGASASHESSY